MSITEPCRVDELSPPVERVLARHCMRPFRIERPHGFQKVQAAPEVPGIVDRPFRLLPRAIAARKFTSLSGCFSPRATEPRIRSYNAPLRLAISRIAFRLIWNFCCELIFLCHPCFLFCYREAGAQFQFRPPRWLGKMVKTLPIPGDDGKAPSHL